METREVIEALGGPDEVAELFGVGRSAVTNWLWRGIPKEHYLAVWQLCLERQVPWSPPGAERVATLLRRRGRNNAA